MKRYWLFLLTLFVVVTSDVNAGLPDPRQAPGSAASVWVPPSGLQQIAIWPNGAPDRSKAASHA